MRSYHLLFVISLALLVLSFATNGQGAKGTNNCPSKLAFDDPPVYNVAGHAIETNNYQNVSAMQVDMYLDNWWTKPFCYPKY